MPGEGSFGNFPDWRDGKPVDRCCLKKIIGGAGIASFSGDAEREFRPLRAHLAGLGFDAGDYLEATYAAVRVEGEWQPRAYQIEDVQKSIADSARALCRELVWYRDRLPASRFFLVGYSLGGVIAFEAASLLLEEDLRAWRGRIGALVSFSSPLRGVDFGILGDLAGKLAQQPNFYGKAGLELVERARNPDSVGVLEARAALLRAAGVRLLTIVDSNDAVVQYGDAVLPSSREKGEVVVVDARLPDSADDVARRYGHGPILSEPRALEAVGRVLGEQECLGPHKRLAPSDRVEQELRELRELRERIRNEKAGG
jgi:pimeloyl-ACP methyl ester carboxylesterase